MKRMSISLALFCVAALAFAYPGMMGGGFYPAGPGFGASGGFERPLGDYAKAAMDSIRTELADRPLGQLTLGELEPFAQRIAEATAKDEYVMKAAMASFMVPGSAQFAHGDTGAGFGYMGTHLLVFGGTLAGFYFLLPEDLRFDELDYLNDSYADIDARWQAHSFNDYLPSFGVLAGGFLTDMVVRSLSSRSGERSARRAIDSGRVEVEPLALPGYLGISFSW